MSREKEMCESVSDLELVRAAQSGQNHAFATLVQRTQNMARAIAFSASGDYETAEELAQEALLTAWTRLADLEEPAKFRPWLAAIVRNTARYARRQRSRHAPFASEGLDRLTHMASSDASPLDLTLRGEDRRRAAEALRVIPRRYREALLLYYTLDESHAQVAAALDLSETAVRQRLCRARKKLRDHLSPVRASGQRLASTASATGVIMLLIQSRQSLAAQLTRGASVGPPSVPIFVGLGALTGALLAISVIAGVILFTGSDDAAASVAQGDDAPDSSMGVEARHLRLNEDPGQTQSIAPTGSVRIGSGKVKRPAPSTSPPSTLHDVQPNSLSSRSSSGGRIRKHGPAILHEEEVVHPLLRPSLSPRELARARWTLD